jgi:hypothetical protein
MGHHVCVVVGYHKNVSVFTPYNLQHFPKMENNVGNVV